jgi:hypothetical protein
MRFKDLVQEVKRIAVREDISRRDAERIDSLLSEAGESLSNEERDTIARVFWDSATSARWTDLLPQHIRNCPDLLFTETGYQVPSWVAEPYVRRQIGNQSEPILNLLLTMSTRNPRFYEVVAEAALIFSPDAVKKLVPLLIEYARSPYAISKRELANTLPRLAGFGFIAEAMELCYEIIAFKSDPRAQEKITQHRADPTDWTAILEPLPKLDDWEYQEVLVKGVRPLADSAPLQTAKMLINAVTDMIRLKEIPEKENIGSTNDSSEIWCGRVDQADRAYLEPKAALVHTLTYACEKVYDTAGSNTGMLEELDSALREAKYMIFDRIRYHLYSRHVSETVGWIRESILACADFADSPYGFEFQQMVRVACENVGSGLLTESERKTIFDQILSGPDKRRFKEWLAERFTEDLYTERQRYFWLTQLKPFASVLFGEYDALYKQLSIERSPPTDDDYSPLWVGETKTGASRSPRSTQDLLAMSDEDLIDYLNEWENVHRDERQWWVDVDFAGLGRAFGEAIQLQPERFLRWAQKWQQIERPVYFRYAIEAANKRIKEGRQDELKEWIRLCRWIVAQKDSDSAPDPNIGTSETSRVAPNWNLARRAVVDLVEVCVSKEINISVSWQPQIYELLRAVCTSSDRYLDENKPIITPRDYLTDAINTTRGRALENLISYGWWLRRQLGQEHSIPEIFQLMQTRFHGKPSLSIPEYTLLAVSFGRLYGLDSRWMEEHVRQFFPRTNIDIWKAAFGGFLGFNQPFQKWFGVIEPEFQFALENADLSEEESKARSSFVNNLGWHLFVHHLWGQFDSRRDLLQLFYARTGPKQWATLFDQVGRSLRAAQTMNPELVNRFKEFFESRLRVGNEEELKEFTFWLEAESLDAEWRLRSLSRSLDITKGRARSASMLVERLRKLADNFPDLAVECFAKLTQAASKERYFYLSPEPAKAILNIGLFSNNPTTVENAMKAQDNLLRMGHVEYLDLETAK